MNDDLQALLGIKYSPEQQATLKELARRANDTLRVQNLLTSDYYVEWDLYGSGGRFRVPGRDVDMGFGKGQAVYPRYIAFKFFKETAMIILSAEMKQSIDAENEKRRLSGVKPMDKTAETAEEMAFAAPLRPDNSEKLLELLPKIILGIEHEWGMDTIPTSANPDKVNWEKVVAIINRPASGEGKPVVADQVTPEQEIASSAPTADEVGSDVAKGLSA